MKNYRPSDADDRRGTPGETSSVWGQFRAFLKFGRISWGWIAAAMLVTLAYYYTVSLVPGSTSALLSGKFTTKAIMDVVINYSSMMVLVFVVNVTSLLA